LRVQILKSSLMMLEFLVLHLTLLSTKLLLQFKLVVLVVLELELILIQLLDLLKLPLTQQELEIILVR